MTDDGGIARYRQGSGREGRWVHTEDEFEAGADAPWWKMLGVRSTVLGQCLAALIAAMGAATTVLAQGGANLPFLQVALAGAAVFLVHGPWLAINLAAKRAEKRRKSLLQEGISGGAEGEGDAEVRFFGGLRVPPWCYLVLSVVDVAGNYCAVVAYRYTLMTSVALISNLSIPFTMGLSRVLLGSRYNKWHYVGAATSLAGMLVLLYADGGGSNTAASDPLLGDMILVVGTALYATSNVLSEAVVKSYDRVEYLACTSLCATVLGLLGALLAGELGDGLPPAGSSLTASVFWILAISYSLIMLCYYYLTPMMLRSFGSVALNVNLLSTDIWSIVVISSVFGLSDENDGGVSTVFILLFLAAFACEAAGICVYSFWGKDPGADLDRLAWLKSLIIGDREGDEPAIVRLPDTIPSSDPAFRLMDSDDDT